MSEPALYSVFDVLLKGDESGWMQMLIFAVMGAVYVFGTIAKSRKQKRGLEEEEESPPPSPVPSARRQEPSRAVRQPPAAQPVRRSDDAGESRRETPGRARPRTIIRPGGALSAFVADIKKELKRAADEIQGVKVPPPRAIAEPEPAKPPQIARPILEPDKSTGFIEEMLSEPEIEEFSEFRPDFSDPDDLKRAILYYEILGKPIAMRE